MQFIKRFQQPRNNLEEVIMDDQIVNRISEYISVEILKQPNRILTPEEPLISSGVIDSFHLIDLALFIEDTFGVHIEDTELNRLTFDNLSQLTSLILQRLS